jgi:hypothetical protein
MCGVAVTNGAAFLRLSALMAEAASWGRPKTWRRGEEKRLKQMHVVAIEDMDRVAAERGMCSAPIQRNG